MPSLTVIITVCTSGHLGDFQRLFTDMNSFVLKITPSGFSAEMLSPDV